MKRVAIIDYFSGNIFSISKAFESLGCSVTLVDRAQGLDDADFAVLPGVGAFGDGMQALKKNGLVESIKRFVKENRPFLGICLGMQLLFSSSEEFGMHEGLDIIRGPVKKLPEYLGLKVPNIGWHTLKVPPAHTRNWEKTIIRSIARSDDLYFIHSYAAYPEDDSDWLAGTSYGDHMFCSAVQKGNTIGCQFHPEKSGTKGLSILKEFLTL